MKLSGILPTQAFHAFQGGFEGRCYSGLRNRYTRYVRPAHIRLLRGAGYIDGQLKRRMRTNVEGVISHFVNVRHADGSTSDRVYSLVVLFDKLDVIGIWTVPSEIFMADSQGQDGDGGDDDDEPALRNCPVDICFTRGAEHSCETQLNLLPEDEDCPDPQSGCPNTACAGGGDGGGTTTTTDIGQVLGA